MSQQQTSPFFVRQVAEYVAGRIGRPLSLDELTWLRDFLVEHVPQQQYLSNIQMAQTARKIGNVVARLVASHSQQREVVDVHEMLSDVMEESYYDTPSEPYIPRRDKNTSFVLEAAKIFGTESAREFSLGLQPPAGYGCLHLVLSAAAESNPENLVRHSWAVYNVGGPGFGRTAYSGDLWSIVSARTGSFTIPEPSEERLLPIQTELDEFYVSIEEFRPQGFYTIGGNVVHFPLVRGENDLVFQGRRGLNAFSQNKGLFEFAKPLTRLNEVTLTFFVQDQPLELPPPCFLEPRVVFDSGPMTITMVLPQTTTSKFAPYAPLANDGLIFNELIQNSSNLPNSQVGVVTPRTGVSVLAAAAPNFQLDIPWQSSFVDGTVIFGRVCLPKYSWKMPLTLIYKRPSEKFDPR